jgi:dipeptide/tripeptide permease
MACVMVVWYGMRRRDSNVAVFFIALYTVALGTGGIKPNVCSSTLDSHPYRTVTVHSLALPICRYVIKVSTFGADQFDDRNPADRAQKETFFVSSFSPML